MAKQDSRHRGLQEGRDAQIAQLRWSGYVRRMSDKRLLKKVCNEELQEENALKVTRRITTNTQFKSVLKDLELPIEYWQQAEQDRLVVLSHQQRSSSV